MSLLQYIAGLVTGTVTGVAPGASVAGSAVFVGQSYEKVKRLSSYANVTATTSTLALAHGWQVSNDKTTWVTVANGSQNAASVALATGTGSAVAATRIVPAPECVGGFQWARPILTVGTVTGTAADTYELGTCYRQQDPE